MVSLVWYGMVWYGMVNVDLYSAIITKVSNALSTLVSREKPGARFTKYLTTILRLSYDDAKVTIDLRRTSNLQNILQRAQGFS